MRRLFGDLSTVGSTKGLLDVTVDSELTSGDTTNHDQTGGETSEGTTEAELTGNLDEAGNGTLTGGGLGLVDLGQHGVSGLGDNGSSETGEKTRSKVDTGLASVGHLRLVKLGEDHLRELLEGDELGDSVGDPRINVNIVFLSTCLTSCALFRSKHTA